MNEWSGVLLVTTDNYIIAMHRDDSSMITNPGCYGIFGGAIEDGETPLEAAAREIREETNLQVDLEDFEPFNIYEQKGRIFLLQLNYMFSCCEISTQPL